MTPIQCRNARRLLQVTQADVAAQLQTTQTVISVFERTGYMMRPLGGETNRMAELRLWFEQAGIGFFNEDEGSPGVRLLTVAG